MNISKALRDARKKSGLTQTEFSKHYKLSQTYISQIEAGKKVPSFDVVEKYQQSCGLPIAILLWGSVDEKDVVKSKQKIFRELKPLVDNLIAQIF